VGDVEVLQVGWEYGSEILLKSIKCIVFMISL